MVKAVVKKIVQMLSTNEEESEILTYGIDMFLTSFTGIILVLFIGFLSGNVIKGVAFILTIMPLRQNAGGFHFKSKRVCVVVSLLIYIIYMLIIRNIFIGEGVQIIIYIVASIAIIMFSPVDSDNNRLDEIEIKTYRYRTAIV